MISMIWLASAIACLLASATVPAFALAAGSASGTSAVRHGPFFLPSGEAARIVKVTRNGKAHATITVLTEAVAVKESGPKATVKKFGEVYAFSPAFIAVRRDQPTRIEFWNLQPDDEHDVALVKDSKVLMYVELPPLTKTSLVFVFHKQGEFDFKCLRHQPEMSGQILVLPSAAR